MPELTDVKKVARQVVRSARYSVRSRASRRHPYLAFARSTRHTYEAVGPGTDVVIDGFPRTANTFATLAFQAAQDPPVTIAHHLHSAAHLIEAVNLGLPAIVLIRDPTGTVISEAIREQPVFLHTVLAAYCRFYEAVLPFLDRLVVGEFDTVTNDLGPVIRELNTRFGTSFRPFVHSEDEVDFVFRAIDERERRPWRAEVDRYLSGRMRRSDFARFLDEAEVEAKASDIQVPEDAVPRPSEARAGRKVQVARALGHPSLGPIRRRADRLYAQVVAAAKAPLPE
jgi:hypothetical protein